MKKKILFITNYYYPYVSGVTEYIRQVCEEMASQGHEVTVLASNHDKLPRVEIIQGVKVIRAPIICKISKGTVSPLFVLWSKKLSKDKEIVNLHLPMLESGLISLIIPKNKLVATYHCDINLPSSVLNNFIVKIMDFSNKVALKRVNKIVVNTIEYMEESRIAKGIKNKLVEISPPIKQFGKNDLHNNKKNTDSIKRIGFCGRIVEEKGLNILLEAFYKIKEKREDTELIIGGDYLSVAGGSVFSKLQQYITKHQLKDVSFIGKIPEEDMENFYASLDVFVLPSINSLESFGMVQVEAMMCGTPVVSSDLPGVRTIVQRTGMGLVSKRGDSKDLAEKIIEILESPEKFVKSSDRIKAIYSTEKTVENYKKCFDSL